VGAVIEKVGGQQFVETLDRSQQEAYKQLVNDSRNKLFGSANSSNMKESKVIEQLREEATAREKEAEAQKERLEKQSREIEDLKRLFKGTKRPASEMSQNYM